MNKPLFVITLLLISSVVILSAEEPTFVLGNLNIVYQGVGSPTAAQRALDLKKGQTISESQLQEALDRLRGLGQYSSVTHNFTLGRKGRSDLLITIDVDEGYRPENDLPIIVDTVEITGNWKTRRNVILSEFLFNEGDSVSSEDIEKSVQRVFNRDLFFEIDWGLYDIDSRTVMELRVREKWTLFPVVYFIGDDGRTRLMLGAVEMNAFGQGFMLLGNYIATFAPGEETIHNFTATYRHRRIGGTPIIIEADGGYFTDENYISNDSGRVDAYTKNMAFISSEVGFEWPGDLKTSLLLGYTHDFFDDTKAAAQGFTGYDTAIGYLSVGALAAYEGVDIADVRRQGFRFEATLEGRIPVDSSPSFIYADATAEYHRVFLHDWLNISSRIMTAYSGSGFIPHQVTMESFLRGSSGREYHNPLVFGFTGELGVAPLRIRWIYLELLGFVDMAWGGASFAEAGTSTLRYRAGPGLRITVPPVARMTLSLDLAWTETGGFETFFGMVRFF